MLVTFFDMLVTFQCKESITNILYRSHGVTLRSLNCHQHRRIHLVNFGMLVPDRPRFGPRQQCWKSVNIANRSLTSTRHQHFVVNTLVLFKTLIPNPSVKIKILLQIILSDFYVRFQVTET